MTERELLALDALRAASVWLTLRELDGDDCEFLNCNEHDKAERRIREKITSAIEHLSADGEKALSDD